MSSSTGKLGRLGSTSDSLYCLTPIHLAIAYQSASQLIVGTTRPRDSIKSLDGSRLSGYLPKTFLPLIAPPVIHIWPPQPWSVPAPLDTSVRPNSDACRSTTSFHKPAVLSSAVNASTAALISVNFDCNVMKKLLCESKPPI